MPIQKEDKKREEKRKRRGEERKIMNSYTQWFVFFPRGSKKKKIQLLGQAGLQVGSGGPPGECLGLTKFSEPSPRFRVINSSQAPF